MFKYNWKIRRRESSFINVRTIQYMFCNDNAIFTNSAQESASNFEQPILNWSTLSHIIFRIIKNC